MNIVFQEITKRFGPTAAVDNASFAIEDGEFFTLLGPSGCGKTTLLRIIAGFYRQDGGNLYFGEKLMNEVPPHRRDIGMVFQNYAIFPHMSVFDNVAYGLRARRLDRKQLEGRVAAALEMVELSHLRDRSPSDMSGGQQQRIALARAIVIRPQLLLMDEPLSNLDAKLRVKMRSDIRALQKELNITAIYVTHDQEEAMAVSDRIAVMNGGMVRQIGSPRQIYRQPASRTVASFIGVSNFVAAEVRVCDQASGVAEVALRHGGVGVRLKLEKPHVGEALFSVRPESIMLEPKQRHGRQLPAVVKEATFLGGKMHYVVQPQDGGPALEAERYLSDSELQLRIGQQIYIDLQLERGVLFDGAGEEVLYRAGA